MIVNIIKFVIPLDYLSKELELDIGDSNMNFGKSDNNGKLK